MKFYVLSKDGQKFGPADIATLNQWVTENRLNRETELENADTGQRQRAGEVQGLAFPAAQLDLAGQDPILKAKEPQQQPQAPQQDPSGQPKSYQPNPSATPTTGQSPYQEPPKPDGNYPRPGYANEDDGSQKLITTAWVLVGIGLFFCCIVLPPFAIYQANRAKRMGNPNAQAPLIVSWIVLAIQLILYGLWGIGFVAALFNSPTL